MKVEIIYSLQKQINGMWSAHYVDHDLLSVINLRNKIARENGNPLGRPLRIIKTITEVLDL